MDPRPRGRPRKKPLGPRRRNGRPPSPERQAAQAAGDRTYQGRPCIRCGGTTRYVSDYGCVPCSRGKAKRRQSELVTELQRWAAQIGLSSVHAAVWEAICDGGLPLEAPAGSGRRSAPRTSRG